MSFDAPRDGGAAVAPTSATGTEKSGFGGTKNPIADSPFMKASCNPNESTFRGGAGNA